MELVSLGKEVLQNIAERAASYRIGQSVLRQLDRALWVVEKCARWAVPPPCTYKNLSVFCFLCVKCWSSQPLG